MAARKEDRISVTDFANGWLLPTLSSGLEPGNYAQRRRTLSDHWGVRVICVYRHQVALAQHEENQERSRFWLFPGGGIRVGETIADAAKREMREETQLDVVIEHLAYIREALPGEFEFYVVAKYLSGSIQLGSDPEKTDKVLRDVAWFSLDYVAATDFVLFPRTLQKRLVGDYIDGWPAGLYIGAAR